jgi:hypothetical protein
LEFALPNLTLSALQKVANETLSWSGDSKSATRALSVSSGTAVVVAAGERLGSKGMVLPIDSSSAVPRLVSLAIDEMFVASDDVDAKSSSLSDDIVVVSKDE